jgi:tetratricopeptide (TPR) repeat protein
MRVTMDAHEADDTTSIAYWRQEGATLRRQNNLAPAAAAFEKALALSSTDESQSTLEVQYDLGQTWAQMGYIEQAIECFTAVIHQEEEQQVVSTNARRRPSRAQIALANVLLDGQGRKESALAIFAAVVAHGPTPLALMAGVAADGMGKHAEAQSFYQNNGNSDDTIDDRHVDPDTALHLMWSRLRSGDQEGGARLRGRLLDHVASSADYVLSTPVAFAPSTHYFTYDMIQLALQSITLTDGLILEFGVYHGKTIRMIAAHFTPDQQPVHGFDTFSGIPEDWHNTPRGAYSTHGSLPHAPDHVQYHIGTFEETLPTFLEAHPGEHIRFMNIDCDLYSSTKDVLDAVHDRVVRGTIIVFDEYVLNPHWKEDEYRAFQEAVTKYGWKYEYIAISLASQQAIVRIL